jgi:predicted O-methyltransferase YrrM
VEGVTTDVAPGTDAAGSGYQFSNDWFNATVKAVWSELLPQLAPSRVLEIGSFEGASACFLIEHIAAQRPLELHCIDTWQGGFEHRPGGHATSDMVQVEQSFRANVQTALSSAACAVKVQVHRDRSDRALLRLLADVGHNYFDMVYVDGSHEAPDVLFDAVTSFKLLRVGGLLVFDDYLWSAQSAPDLLKSPKIAIDAFTSVHAAKIRMLTAPLYQIYLVKTAD